jgi:glycosyltransferase involved in cell wall biosynthesis
MPTDSASNRFVNLFAKSIADQGYAVTEFRWMLRIAAAADVVVLHWPDEFFRRIELSQAARLVGKLLIITIAKRLCGARFVWVAHNAIPHDADTGVPRLAAMFLWSLDGVIYLSAHSRELIERLYPQSRRKRSLTTVHGHYRDVAVTPATPFRPPQGEVRLAYVGQIRRYKNLDVLIEAAAPITSGLHLTLSGGVTDGAANCATADLIAARAEAIAHIKLDLSADALSDADFEARVDDADAIVLPYRRILHSGTALFALSRNRPVLAPRLGSLPQLRDEVGPEWIYLYDGELTSTVLEDFIRWLREIRRGEVVAMDAFDWTAIGRDLGRFIDEVRASDQ